LRHWLGPSLWRPGDEGGHRSHLLQVCVSIPLDYYSVGAELSERICQVAISLLLLGRGLLVANFLERR
jgi:hypothetical protein